MLFYQGRIVEDLQWVMLRRAALDAAREVRGGKERKKLKRRQSLDHRRVEFGVLADP
jgi:hypothetical protein